MICSAKLPFVRKTSLYIFRGYALDDANCDIALKIIFIDLHFETMQTHTKRRPSFASDLMFTTNSNAISCEGWLIKHRGKKASDAFWWMQSSKVYFGIMEIYVDEKKLNEDWINPPSVSFFRIETNFLWSLRFLHGIKHESINIQTNDDCVLCYNNWSLVSCRQKYCTRTNSENTKS